MPNQYRPPSPWLRFALGLVVASSVVVAVAGSCASAAAQQAPSPPAPSAIEPGRWSGGLDFGQGREELDLRILPTGGLLDLPGQRLYGYPLSSIHVDGKRIGFSLFEGQPDEAAGQGAGGADGDAAGGAGGGAAGGGSPLVFSGELGADKNGEPRIEGRVTRDGLVGGSFDLAPSPLRPGPGESAYVVDTGRGLLPGTLLLPEGEGPFPVVLILAGAGTTDRDGNNYAVPGKNDALKYLAQALRDRGVASLRYDKRGAGESYALVPTEASLRFDDYVSDAAAALVALRSDGRFSRVVVAGHTEGALVASGALLDAGAKSADGLALLCASGKSAAETVEAAVAGAPPELKKEGAAILKAIRAGTIYPAPSPYFSDFFRPSFQPYLASWFRHDLKAELRGLKVPVLLVQGNRDFQTTLAEFDILVRARPDAAAFVLPDMNHALKKVSPDLDENYRAFTDPSFPLAPELPDLLAAFAKGESLPDQAYRYRPAKH